MLNVNVVRIPIVLWFVLSSLLLFKTPGEKQALTFMRTIYEYGTRCTLHTYDF